MHPAPPGDADIIALFARLSEAEQNASQACSKIAQIVTEEELANRAREDAATHEARRQALGKLIEALGGSAPRLNECREILIRGAEAAASALSDISAMEALKVIRDELGAAYDEAIRCPLLDDKQRASLAQLAPSNPCDS
jgi:hypothetical protein